MSNEETQTLIAEFNTRFNELRKDLNKALEKITDKLVVLGEANISCAKDIEATRNWYEEKTKEMEKDIDGIGETVRRAQKEIKENLMETVVEKIKSGDLMTRLLVAGSFLTGMGAIILLLLK